MDMLEAKGPIFKSALKYIKNNLGADGFESFLKQLPKETQQFLSSPILNSEFYPSDQLISVMESYVKMENLNPEQTYHELGRFSSDEGMKGIYRIFLKVGSPSMMFRQTPLVYKSYYSQGSMQVVDSTKNDATLRLTDSGIRHIAICGRITGYIERTMELAGGKNVRLTHTKCFAKGDINEEWYGFWH